MNIVRLRSRVLILAVVGALVVSFTFAGIAAAAPHTCTFTATSSARFSAITANQYGSLSITTGLVTKYTNGCGSEYGTLTDVGTNGFVSIQVTVSVGSAQTSASYLPNYPNVLATPIIVGNSSACATIAFNAPPDPPAYGSGCTPL